MKIATKALLQRSIAKIVLEALLRRSIMKIATKAMPQKCIMKVINGDIVGAVMGQIHNLRKDWVV